MSISNYAETKLLDTINNTSFAVSATYIQLHTGNPGEDATDNVATENTREQATWNSASGNNIVTDANVTWTNVAATETISHWSLWDAVTGGNPLWYGALTSPAAMQAGDTFQITSLTLTLD
jgi:hypothetical protein